MDRASNMMMSTLVQLQVRLEPVIELAMSYFLIAAAVIFGAGYPGSIAILFAFAIIAMFFVLFLLLLLLLLLDARSLLSAFSQTRIGRSSNGNRNQKTWCAVLLYW